MNADLIPDNRSKHVIQQLLLNDPLQVSPHDFDPALVDTSQDHRQEMRRKIYSKKENYKPKQNYSNFCTSKCSYADEELDPWKSTMRDDYVSKQLNPNNTEYAKKLAHSMNSTHFSMEFGEPAKYSKSSIKTDYVKYDLNNIIVPSRYGSNPVKEGKFPLIRCEEMGEPLRLAKRKPAVTIKTRLDERASSLGTDPSTKSISHISFGNDTNDWKSISQKTLLPHEDTQKKEHSEYELLEKTKSTVLDNPDLELDPMETVHQAEFKTRTEIDWNSLIFDNSVSKKALNGTHFSLGTDPENQLHSEYKTSFVPLKNSKRKIKKAGNSNSLCIIAEDFEDRHIGKSSQKDDYPALSLKSNTMVDVNDIKPLEKNEKIARERYEKGGRIESVPGCVPYQSLVGNQETPNYESVHRQDYKKIDLSKFTDTVRVDTKDLRKTHFSFECDLEGGSNFKKREDGIDYDKLNKLRDVLPAGYGGNHSVTRQNDQFQVTVNNTITRYPYFTDTFQTTVQQTYKGLSVPKPSAFNPPHDQVEGHLHPQITKCGDEFKHIRELSTVNRRTYVAPEVMKEKM
ncbi:hypothetical protein HDV01_003924 [Terramyces sp. JEL0728]|nr:hypothetical protein HDV01_003924 [Terramyces sp. JEL0728]